jgi:hypothetical protein
MRWHFPDLKFLETPFVDRFSRHYHRILTHPRCLIRYPDNFTNRILTGNRKLMSRAPELHSQAFVMPELAACLPNGGTKVNVLFCRCEPNLHVGAANRTPSTELPSAARLPLLSLTSVSSTSI